MIQTKYTTTTLCLKNDIDIGHYSFDVLLPIVIIFLAEMLLREEALKRQAIFPPRQTNAFA